MEKREIQEIAALQREFFESGLTRDVEYRKNSLEKIGRAIDRFQDEICAALKDDLGKSYTESMISEVSMVKAELEYMLKNIDKLASDRRAKTPQAQFAADSFIYPVPFGCVLIMSPWNYPFLLAFDPLIDAIAAGNVALVKPSAYAPETSLIIKKVIESCFSPAHVSVVTGGRAENTHLLDEKFDMIFFTGSKTVGKLVMRKASEHLTPVVLELGGKSPCIVMRDAKIKLAARRIVFGKLMNCGQTCVAPDYIYCHEDAKDELVKALIKEIRKQYGKSPLESPSYGKIINKKHFNRITRLIPGAYDDLPVMNARIAAGGNFDESKLKIEPTVLEAVSVDDPVMGEEIFGPIIPVLTYKNESEVVSYINSQDRPLAMYIFTEDSKNARRIMNQCRFGGGCINDVLIHLATSEMPFGGVGESGMGMYHGKYGFEAFSHMTSIVDKKTWMDTPIRYQPYTSAKKKILKKML